MNSIKTIDLLLVTYSVTFRGRLTSAHRRTVRSAKQAVVTQ